MFGQPEYNYIQKTAYAYAIEKYNSKKYYLERQVGKFTVKHIFKSEHCIYPPFIKIILNDRGFLVFTQSVKYAVYYNNIIA